MLPATFAAPFLTKLFTVLATVAPPTQAGGAPHATFTTNIPDPLELNYERPVRAFNTNFPFKAFFSADGTSIGIAAAIIAKAKPRIGISFANHDAVEYFWRSTMG